jgi:hypothetical protein
VTQAEIEEVARLVIGQWMKNTRFDLFGPQARAAALFTFARICEEMAEEEIAKLPDWTA